MTCEHNWFNVVKATSMELWPKSKTQTCVRCGEQGESSMNKGPNYKHPVAVPSDTKSGSDVETNVPNGE